MAANCCCKMFRRVQMVSNDQVKANEWSRTPRKKLNQTNSVDETLAIKRALFEQSSSDFIELDQRHDFLSNSWIRGETCRVFHGVFSGDGKHNKWRLTCGGQRSTSVDGSRSHSFVLLVANSMKHICHLIRWLPVNAVAPAFALPFLCSVQIEWHCTGRNIECPYNEHKSGAAYEPHPHYCLFFSLSLSLFLSFSLSLFLHRFLLILILSCVTNVSNQFGTSRLPVAMIHLPSIEQCLHCLIISIKVIFEWLNNNQRVCRRFGPKPLAKCESTLTTMNWIAVPFSIIIQ